MKKLYEEIQDRLTHLRSLEPTEENKGRISELILASIRIQQDILNEI